MIQRAYQLAVRAWYVPRRPGVDLKYRAFIRRFPCIGCGSTRFIEFMHTGPRGLGQKSDDADGLPGCPACHRNGPQALHKIGPVKFQQVHQISFEDLRVMFRGQYEKMGANTGASSWMKYSGTRKNSNGASRNEAMDAKGRRNR